MLFGRTIFRQSSVLLEETEREWANPAAGAVVPDVPIDHHSEQMGRPGQAITCSMLERAKKPLLNRTRMANVRIAKP